MIRPKSILTPVPRLSFWLTGGGMVAERVLRRFWPFYSILMVVLAALMLGLHDMVPVEWVWAIGAVAACALLGTLIWGIRGFTLPRRADILDRLDSSLPGRPIQAVLDRQGIGTDDPDAVALWRAHQDRMRDRASTARAVVPNLRLSDRDPYGLRFSALLVFVTALVFGSIWRLESVTGMTPGAATAAPGPSWEGWVEPPRYTGLPTLYLADLDSDTIDLPQGSRITLQFYGEVGALSLSETISGEETTPSSETRHVLDVVRDGDLRIQGTGGRDWTVAVTADDIPQIAVAGPAEAEADGRMTLPFVATDDYGVETGAARIELDLAAVDRRHGLSVDPEPREAVTVELPMPIAGDRADFQETLIEDFSEHPWANLPVTITLSVRDAADQQGRAEPLVSILPARRFFDPLAAAVIEQRRDLLWSRDNARRVAQVLRAVSHRPEDIFRSDTAYLRLRVTLRRLETFTEFGLTVDQRDEIAKALWDLALILEDGTLSDALERMRRAQERLSEAMKNGASDQEIAELMQELREATDDYLRQLQRQAQQDGTQQDGPQQGQNGDAMQMTQDDLQRMMDRIQELMEQGRMAEAQQALQEFQQMMENMRVTQGQGQNGQSEGQRAMEGLAETLREQQGLSDQAFRDLQEQFNPNTQSGQNQQNEGRDGGEGRGERHDGQRGRGEGQGGEQSGEGREGDMAGQGSLADRQQALRDELRRQQQGLPSTGTPEGDAARDALDRAGRAMEGAEGALREEDLPGAIDRQAEAMEALREGMRSLGEALAQQQQQQQPGQGMQEGDMRAQNRDPLGRNQGARGSIGTDENLLQGEDVYRRAQELLDEIRRRSGEGERPDLELDYLRRLLDRF